MSRIWRYLDAFGHEMQDGSTPFQWLGEPALCGPSPLHDCLEWLYFSAHRTHALELVLLLIYLRAQLPIPLPREATYARRWIECRFLQDHLVVLKLGIPCVKGVSFGPTEPVLFQQRLNTSPVVQEYNDLFVDPSLGPGRRDH
jgi:hypothetical protein